MVMRGISEIINSSLLKEQAIPGLLGASAPIEIKNQEKAKSIPYVL